MATANILPSFVHVANWSHSPRPLGHFRSHSSMTTSAITAGSASPPASPKSLTSPKPKSHLEHQFSASSLSNVNSDSYNDELSTLPDPRSRSMTPARHGSTGSSQHPDLTDEVAALSTKLINAINHQTILDDTLSATRHELETANDRIAELEAQNASQREILSGDVWVRKSAVEVEKKTWQAQVAEEKAKRLEVEKAKKLIEQELENLTAALFEEANKMVIRAKEEAQAEHDIIQRKNDQLKAQLADSESLLKSQQEQLSELKQVMETITSEQDDYTNNTAPSSPGVARLEFRDDERFSSPTPTQGGAEAVAPAPPTSFPHLIQPVLRFDINTYDDFVNLTKISKIHTGGSVRSSSGSLAGLSLPSLGLGGSTSSVHLSNGSTTSLGNAASGGNSSAPHSPSGSSSLQASPTPIPHIRDTRFFKRVLTEDIEPTLRLDVAPGLSWLARRSVMSAMTDGSLVVEPVTTHAGNSFIMSISKPHLNPCSLCGESRKDPLYLRNHRFRTSEQGSAQRYPLCKYCLNRVRSTCDFLSFLRMVKDGHWKAEDDDQEKSAWEESVRLREQMFWARLGGGVIPCTSHGTIYGDKSPRPSMDQLKTEKAFDEADGMARESVEESPDSAKFEDAVAVLPEPVDSIDIPTTKIESVESVEEVDSASEPPPPPPKDETHIGDETEVAEKVKVPQTPPEQIAKE
ncbi:unnamed protein product [Clonostachys chloroleuca]|uniref:GDP/GTP exchange factor Sec2 N-terminal domain-containing protein n=1 Tax=Clonostachys chloroleuca TaxID=1926264 RepID=A0AA35LYN7_9HYPO|nr:unnamed protein product [Clonostachys chloroleuca]